MKSETALFVEKAKESLAASKLLAANNLYDFAASRAYYTMFYIAEAFLWEKDLSFSSHSAVISNFGKAIARPGIVPIELHRYLIDAQDKRTQGDYSIDQSTRLNEAEVQELIRQSEQFIQLADKILLTET